MQHNRICSSFTQSSTCKNGSQCPLLHIVPTAADPNLWIPRGTTETTQFSSTSSVTASHGRDGMQKHHEQQGASTARRNVCRLWMSGQCRFGTRCKFLHPARSRQSAQDDPNQTKAVVCSFCGGKGHVDEDCTSRASGGVDILGLAPDDDDSVPWRSYHKGDWYSGRTGGWTPWVDGMEADWHCCGCDDSRSKHCMEHKVFRTCRCYNGTDREMDFYWMRSFVERGWPVEELAKEAGVVLPPDAFTREQ
jgi:hypothetical protein